MDALTDQQHRGEKLFPETVFCLDQTQLVKTLIKIDDYTDEHEDLRGEIDALGELSFTNGYGYTLMEDGETTFVPENRYFLQMEKWQKRKDQLKDELWSLPLSYTESAVKYKEKTELNTKIALYDAADCVRQQVYSWWLIPYWLGDCLAEREETILRAYGCTWWGVTDLVTSHPRTSPVLLEIITKQQSVHLKKVMQ